MIRIIKAETKLLLRKKAVLATIAVYLAFFVLMFFQKAVNHGSGFYQIELITPFYLMSYSGALICVTSLIPMSIIFSIAGGESFEDNTISQSVLTVGRIRLTTAKMICLMIVSILISLLVFFVALIFSIFINPSIDDFSCGLLIEYFLVSSILSFFNGIGAFLISSLFKKNIAGIIGNIIGVNVLTFIGGFFPKLYEFFSGSYVYYIVSDVFSILSEKNDIQLVIAVTPDSSKTILAWLTITIVITLFYASSVLLSNKRDYTV